MKARARRRRRAFRKMLEKMGILEPQQPGPLMAATSTTTFEP